MQTKCCRLKENEELNRTYFYQGFDHDFCSTKKNAITLFLKMFWPLEIRCDEKHKRGGRGESGFNKEE